MKKLKKHERTEPKIKNKSILPGAILAALVVSVIVYVVMINIEKNALSDFEKGTIFVAVKEIPEGQLLKEENAAEYVQPREMDKKLIPAAAVTELGQITNQLPITAIDTGAFLMAGMFENMNEITSAMQNPVIAGLKADDLYQIVGGILRAGDRIHIYTVDEETGETALVWKDVFVQQVFDSSGVVIQNEDKETAAQRINIFLEQESVETFYTELAAGSLRVVKEWD